MERLLSLSSNDLDEEFTPNVEPKDPEEVVIPDEVEVPIETEEVPTEEDSIVEDTVEDETAEEDVPTGEPKDDEPTEVTPEEIKYLDPEKLAGQKLKIKWNGVEQEVNAEDITKFVQMGIDADIKDYKGALKYKKEMEAKEVSPAELEMLQKLRDGDSSVVKDMIAKGKFKLDDVRDDVHEYEQEDVDARAEEINKIPAQPTEVETILQSITPEIDKAYEEVKTILPGLESFTERMVQQGNAQFLDVIVSNTESGAFKKLAPNALKEYLLLTDREKQNINNNNDAFVSFYDKFLTAETPQQSEAVAEPTTPQPQAPAKSATQRASVEDIEAKKSAGRGSRGTRPQGNPHGTKRSSEEILNQYLGEIDNGTFDSNFNQDNVR